MAPEVSADRVIMCITQDVSSMFHCMAPDSLFTCEALALGLHRDVSSCMITSCTCAKDVQRMCKRGVRGRDGEPTKAGTWYNLQIRSPFLRVVEVGTQPYDILIIQTRPRVRRESGVPLKIY